MRILPQKLSLKLIVSLTVILVIVGMVANYLNVKTQEQQLLDAMILGADQLSGSICSATWHAMLIDQRQAAYEIMQTIALKQGISSIRILNKEGRVMFSTVPNGLPVEDKRSEACAMCHSVTPPLVEVGVRLRARIYHSRDGSRKLGIVSPIYNEPSCSNADCHAHPPEVKMLGVLDVSLDLAQVDAELAAVRQRVLIITGSLVLSMALFIVFFTRHFVDAPIKELIEGTKAVSAMQLDKSIAIDSSEELGELARSFETMRIRLKGALDEVNQFTHGLETKVEERTEQLKAAHQKLLQSDRLASLGQLSASVAHEINNPLSGVLNLSMLMQRIVGEEGIPRHRIQEFKRYLAQVVAETGRVGRIVQDLLAFSRRSKPQRAMANMNSIVRTTVTLVEHKLRLMNVQLDLQLDERVSPVFCDGSQMKQVLVNLILNGAEAAHGKGDGRVTVRTQVEESGTELLLEVIDNGEGIAPEHLSKIFDPFFTTKGEGKGVGLGLAVVYGIVHEHSGEIKVHSTPGKGTRFSVRLPLAVALAEDGQEAPKNGQLA